MVLWRRATRVVRASGGMSIAIQVANERERVRFVQWAARGDHFPASLLEQIMMRARRVLKRSRRGQIFISSV